MTRTMQHPTPILSRDTLTGSMVQRPEFPIWFDAEATGFYFLTVPLRYESGVKRTRTWLIDEIDATDDVIQHALMGGTTPVETVTTIFDWDVASPHATETGHTPLRLEALDAVDTLRRVLGLSEQSAARLAEISRNTIRNWRTGHDAYPATVKRLLQLSGLVSSLEAALGPRGLSAWLDGSSDAGGSRRELLAHTDGLAVIARDAGRVLFSTPTGLIPDAESLGLEPDESTDQAGYAPQLYDARPRRDRREATD